MVVLTASEELGRLSELLVQVDSQYLFNHGPAYINDCTLADATMDEVENSPRMVTRIPVYDETIDNICGLLHVKRSFAAELVRMRAITR